VLLSFVATCKRNAVELFAWFSDVLSRIATHPINKIEALTLWLSQFWGQVQVILLCFILEVLAATPGQKWLNGTGENVKVNPVARAMMAVDLRVVPQRCCLYRSISQWSIQAGIWGGTTAGASMPFPLKRIAGEMWQSWSRYRAPRRSLAFRCRRRCEPSGSGRRVAQAGTCGQSRLRYVLRMTQHAALRSHLFPGDSLEAVCADRWG